MAADIVLSPKTVWSCSPHVLGTYVLFFICPNLSFLGIREPRQRPAASYSTVTAKFSSLEHCKTPVSIASSPYTELFELARYEIAKSNSTWRSVRFFRDFDPVA